MLSFDTFEGIILPPVQGKSFLFCTDKIQVFLTQRWNNMQLKTNNIISHTYKYLNKFGWLASFDPLKIAAIFLHETVDITNALFSAHLGKTFGFWHISVSQPDLTAEWKKREMKFCGNLCYMLICCFSCHLYGALEEKTDAPQLQVGPDWVWRGGGLFLQFWLFAFHPAVALTLQTLPHVPGRVPSYRKKENPYTWTIWGFHSKGMTSLVLLPWERNCIATKCDFFFFFEVCSGVTPSSVGMEYTAQNFCWAEVRVPRAKDLIHHTLL